MRIPPETIRSLVGLHTQRVGKSQAVGPATGVGSVFRPLSSDSVKLSEEAELLNTLKQGVKAMPEVDFERVEAVRQEMASGRFKIDANGTCRIPKNRGSSRRPSSPSNPICLHKYSNAKNSGRKRSSVSVINLLLSRRTEKPSSP